MTSIDKLADQFARRHSPLPFDIDDVRLAMALAIVEYANNLMSQSERDELFKEALDLTVSIDPANHPLLVKADHNEH